MSFPPPIGSFKINFQGLDLIRGRDCVIWVRDLMFPVAVDPVMLQGGWPGGQGVRWVDSDTDEFTVTYADGRGNGFLICGSDESAEQYISTTRTQIVYGYAVCAVGDALISTSSYEKYTYASRLGGPPYVELTYTLNEPLYFSLRGLWTNEDELTLSGSLLAPASSVGGVMQVPQPSTQFFLGVQTSL